MCASMCLISCLEINWRLVDDFDQESKSIIQRHWASWGEYPRMASMSLTLITKLLWMAWMLIWWGGRELPEACQSVHDPHNWLITGALVTVTRNYSWLYLDCTRVSWVAYVLVLVHDDCTSTSTYVDNTGTTSTWLYELHIKISWITLRVQIYTQYKHISTRSY